MKSILIIGVLMAGLYLAYFVWALRWRSKKEKKVSRSGRVKSVENLTPSPTDKQ